jgi:hypothetical protein
MRTSVTLDDNAHEIASHYAHANGITLSKALSELVRKATAPKEPEFEIKIMPDGLPLLPSRGRVITSELVKQILDEEYE